MLLIIVLTVYRIFVHQGTGTFLYLKEKHGVLLAQESTWATRSFSAASIFPWKKKDKDNAAESSGNNDKTSARKEYSVDQVSAHNSKEKGIWVTYKGGVYDITKLAAKHPGKQHSLFKLF